MAAGAGPAPDGPDRHAPPTSPRRHGCTCARSSCAPRSAISGANFMVAETGTLVVVESEGNGRMCLTLPETLISVVGIEKVVPSWRDLEVFLQTLPRSSTAERMNPYTSHVDRHHRRATAPGPSTWCCSTTAAPTPSPTRSGRQALRCIRCSACLNVCPVYERAGGHAYGSVYPGPIGAILTPQLRGTAERDRRLAARTPRPSAAPATRSARSPSTSPRSWSTCANGWRIRAAGVTGWRRPR